MAGPSIRGVAQSRGRPLSVFALSMLAPLAAALPLAAEDVQPPELIPNPVPAPHVRHDPPRGPEDVPSEPGRVTPASAAKPIAIEFTWEGYRSLVVVGEGVGLMRPAWVATYEAPLADSRLTDLLTPLAGMFGYRQNLAVAYRAQAFLDAQGRLHIDARQAVISGPMADEWFADSFQFTLPDRVETLDDQDSGNQGTVDCVVDPLKQPALFNAWQTRLQVLVGGGI